MAIHELTSARATLTTEVTQAKDAVASAAMARAGDRAATGANA
jgi:hypothetical protein